MAKPNDPNNYKLFYDSIKNLSGGFREDIQKNCRMESNSTFYNRLENPENLSEAEKVYIKAKAKELITTVQRLAPIVADMF